MNLFDFVPENFFNLLSSKNKRIYLASILEAFKVYETGSILGIEKKIVVDDLVYFLDSDSMSYTVEDEDQEDEEADPKSKRDLANFILRKMEETGWIYVDVNNDYEEILNFTDTAITLCEAILKAYPQFEYGEELPADYVNPNEYQGYIYQIYSLLTQKDNIEYAIMFNLVYSDTKHLIRAIRRLDARMKDYITSVVDNTEIKDLIEKLMFYKTDVYDAAYSKLKIGDNINRYRLTIITRLRELQTDPVAVQGISKNYLPYCKNEEEALSRANRYIDEVIDAFNAIDDFISEIDNKNRTYINSTIGKIKFLLSEDDNIVGKLNRILRFVKDEHKKDKTEKAMRVVEGLYSLRTEKIYDCESSLYTPRGSYQRNYNQILDEAEWDFEMNDEFMAQFRASYNEDDILKYMNSYMEDGKLLASRVIECDSSDDEVLMLVYCIILAVDKNYKIEILDNYVEHNKFTMKDFMIERK